MVRSCRLGRPGRLGCRLYSSTDPALTLTPTLTPTLARCAPKLRTLQLDGCAAAGAMCAVVAGSVTDDLHSARLEDS